MQKQHNNKSHKCFCYKFENVNFESKTTYSFVHSLLKDLKTPLKTENYENYHNINNCTSEFTFILFVLFYRISIPFLTPKYFFFRKHEYLVI